MIYYVSYSKFLLSNQPRFVIEKINYFLNFSAPSQVDHHEWWLLRNKVEFDAEILAILWNMPLYIMLEQSDVLIFACLRAVIKKYHVKVRVFQHRHPVLNHNKVKLIVLHSKSFWNLWISQDACNHVGVWFDVILAINFFLECFLSILYWFVVRECDLYDFLI